MKWCLALFLTFVCPVAFGEQKQEQPKSMEEIVMMPVVYRVPGMDKVQIRSNLSYKTGDFPLHKMDVYIPPDAGKNSNLPAVLLIHGGAGIRTTPKDWGIYISWGKLIAASGLVAVTFNHRLGYPDPLLAEAASDVTDAINFVRANADSLHIDKDRLCLASYSAGGPMLSIAMRDTLPYIRCLVAWYSFLDIQQSDLHRQHETPELVREYSPITYLKTNGAKISPIFVARGGLDQIPTMNDSIDRFVKEAIDNNISLDFANHPEGVHGFDNQNDDARSREIIQKVIEFMKVHLGEEQQHTFDPLR